MKAAPEVEKEYEIKPEAVITDKTNKKETTFLEDELEGEDMDEDTEGANEDGNAREQ
jgi:hypothetical protein